MHLLGAHGDAGDETTEQVPARLLCDSAQRGGRDDGNGLSVQDEPASESPDDTQLGKKFPDFFHTLKNNGAEQKRFLGLKLSVLLSLASKKTYDLSAQQEGFQLFSHTK